MQQYGTALVAACCGDYSSEENYRNNGFQALLKHGADVNLDGGGELPYAVIAMACHGDNDGLKILIEAGADVNKTGGKWHTALQAAMCDDSDGTSPFLLNLVDQVLSIFWSTTNVISGHR